MDAKSWQHNPKWDGKFSWMNTSFLVLSPIFATLLIPYSILHYGFHSFDLYILAFMIGSTGFGITAGYHRLFSHSTYEAHPVVRWILLILGAATLENSALKWSSDHRYHHRFVDKEGDPYNINRGFFYAHMGWIFFKDPENRSYENVKDLAADPLVVWQDKYYLPIALAYGFGVPTLIGAYFGRPMEGLIWGGLFRTILVHHLTFLINSAAHVVGNRPYSLKVSAGDCWWLAIFTQGEGYHNFHHTFGNDYRNGVRWYHFDPAKWLIYSLSRVGLTYNLNRTPDAQLLKAKLESMSEQFRNSGEPIPAQLESMRATIEAKVQEFQLKYREFQTWKESRAVENAREKRIRARYWKRRLHAERSALENAVKEYKTLLRFAMSATRA